MHKIDIHTLDDSNNATRFKNKFSLLSSVHDMRELQNDNNEFLIDGFVVALITSGEIQIAINKDTFHCAKGDILICTPRNIIEKGMFNIDFDAFGFLFTSNYAEDAANRLNFDWMQRVLSVQHDIVHATEEEATILQDYFNLIYKLINSLDSERKESKLNSLVDSMIYTLLDIGHNNGKEVNKQVCSSQEYIFQRFIKMLTPESGSQHIEYLTVNEYAERLNLTPKYFSNICKQLTGKTASQIINKEIIKSANIMLHNNKYSIKQIAAFLGFANQSHFGTFYRKHTGMSPLDFRRNGQ